nr:glycosyltransferase family 4 protein [Candidatus Gracilibacteria bacterium]
MQKINIIQFLPYFSPHKGGVENVAEEFSSFYVLKGFGEVINVVFDIGQKEKISSLLSSDIIYGSDKKTPIGYKQKGYTVYLLPAFDLIHNFPFPKFWEKKFWEILRLTELKTGIIQTHTRFFLSSFLGGLFAKHYKLNWVHIEHGSDYVKLGSKFKSKIAYIYDKIIGKWIFKKANKLVAISEGVNNFIKCEFIGLKNINIIYNGIDFISGDRLDNGENINIGFAGRIVNLKGINLLIDVVKDLSENHKNIKLFIVGDGDDKVNLEKYIKDNNIKNIKFLGPKNREYIAKDFLPKIDILVNPSYQEGLPTTVLEGLISGCVVVATDVGGTKEISNKDDLIIIEKGKKSELKKGLEKAILNYKVLGGKSSAYVKEKFNWDIVIDNYFNLYKSL